MKKQPNYLVQPDYLGERKANYKAGKKINEKFKMVTRKEVRTNVSDGLNGNVGMSVMINKKTLKTTITKEFASVSSHRDTHVGLYEAISSALVLYRIICMFKKPKIELEGADGYKCPWFAYFQHKSSGTFIGLGEWKGAFGIWTPFNDPKELTGELKKDVIELLDLLLSDRAPHPYDDLTAGGVA